MQNAVNALMKHLKGNHSEVVREAERIISTIVGEKNKQRGEKKQKQQHEKPTEHGLSIALFPVLHV